MMWRGKNVKVPGLCTLADRHDYGRWWYKESGASIQRYADRRGLELRYVCDVLAILSPRVSVRRNVKLAREYIETGGIVKGVMRSRERALLRYECWGAFNGPKVNAFSKALQGDSSAVVIDAWVYRLLGIETPTDATYKRATKRVNRCAHVLDWGPAETQAALWCGARSLCGFTDSYSPLLMS